jgi:hypothetical protein
MNRIIKFGVYFLVGIALFSIFTAVLGGGGGGGETLNGTNSSTAPTATPTTTPERGDEYYSQEIADRLSKSNVTVLSVEVKNNATTVRYVPKRPNESAVVEEIGTISIQYSTLVRDGWNVSKLEAKVIPPREQVTANSSNSTNSLSQSASPSANNSTNQSGANKTAETNGSASSTSDESREPVATWHVKTRWVADMGGENTSQKYLQKILDSIELEGPGSVSRMDRRRGDAQEPSASGASRRGRVPDYPQDEEENTTQCETGDRRDDQCATSSGNESTVVFGDNS